MNNYLDVKMSLIASFLVQFHWFYVLLLLRIKEFSQESFYEEVVRQDIAHWHLGFLNLQEEMQYSVHRGVLLHLMHVLSCRGHVELLESLSFYTCVTTPKTSPVS